MDRRSALTHLLTAGAGALVGFSAAKANAGKPHVAPGPGKRWPNTAVTVSVEDPYGRAFGDYWYAGSRYLAGELGERYVIRLTNNSGSRVEAVVTVDGRDVITGEVGNYSKHRGYVIDPWGSVVIDGFRQSMSQVASFRFGRVSSSYSARMGTPQNVGVIGVAVFDEKPRPQPRPRPRPLAPPRDYYDYDWWGADESTAAPFPGASKNKKESRSRGRLGSSAGEAAPRGDRSAGAYGGAHSRPAPSPDPHLGTDYGESRYSSAREVTFKRKSKRPDALLTMYYDSLDGLRRRGVPVDPPPPPYYEPPYRDPNPWPDRRFAPPPPRY